MKTLDSSSAHGRFYEDIGAWIRCDQKLPAIPRPALFLDRDGVIVEEVGYLSRPADMTVISGAVETISLANQLSIPVIEVTNQAGIGRGYFGWQEFIEVESALISELARNGGFIDAAFACPYHPDGIAPYAYPTHPARKPRPGMLLAAKQFLNIDLENSWIIGDKHSDLLAGHNAGLRGGLHVLTGHGKKHRQTVMEWNPENFECRLGDSIKDAPDILSSMLLKKS